MTRVQKRSGLMVAVLLGGAGMLYGCSSGELEFGAPDGQPGESTPRQTPEAQALEPTGIPDKAPGDGDVAIVAAAREGLPSYLSQLEPGDAPRFGFADASEFARVDLGAPFEYFALLDSGEANPLNLWSVPVEVGGEARAFVDVKRSGKGYRAYAFGSAQLAKELGVVTRARAQSNAGPITSRAILRSFTHSADFVSFDRDLHAPDGVAAMRVQALASAHLAMGEKLARQPVRAAGNLRAPLDAQALKALLAP
jgi:hypothetical protein